MHNSVYQLDVAILGGGTAAIAAALSLKAEGLSVAVFSHRTYLGEDICDALRLVLPVDMELADPMSLRLYGEAVRAGNLLRPMHLKGTLDRLLAEADIPVLFGAYPAGCLVDGHGTLAGLRISHRGGTQVIGCRMLLDGSLRGEVARMCGLSLSAPDRDLAVLRRVIGGEALAGEEQEWDAEGDVVIESGGAIRRLPLWTHHSRGSLADGSWAAWMQLEQVTRLRTYRRGQALSADGIWADTGERLHPQRPAVAAGGDFSKVPAWAVGGMAERFWCSGPIANVDRATRERLLRHDGAISWGRALAKLMLNSDGSAGQWLSPERELCPAAQVGAVDVLVVGGGTAGAPAAIAAAREGARTLLTESLAGLGGVGTLGLIGRYWFGNRVGFTAEIDAAVARLTTLDLDSDSWDVEAKMHWYHQSISEAGGRIWYKTGLLDVLQRDGRVIGARLCTPQGIVEVRAACVVDATGSAEVAARAGASCVPIGDGHLAMQGTGLPGRQPGQNYVNTDYDFIDDTDPQDASSAHVAARVKFHQAFDAGQHVDSRERRRVVGDYEVTPQDIRLGRVFADTIVKARSNFDTHGFTVHPIFEIVPPGHEPLEAYVPLRALLPKGLDGILTTGLGISAHRDAMPVIRMQADVQNQGYAAGLIAAMARDGRVRALDIDVVQARLVELGILAPEIRGAADRFPLPPAEIQAALAASVDDPNQVDRIFTLPDAERDQHFRDAFHRAQDDRARLHFALVLGILHQPDGAEILARHIEATPWDTGWDYRGMGQFGASMSPLDAHIIALGRCRQVRWLDLLGAKADALPAAAAFSHYRALAEALQTIGDARGAPIIVRLLSRPGLAGHHMSSQQERLARVTDDSNETAVRNRSLIELHLAAALFRLDPADPLGRTILRNYSRDLRALFARFARRLLAEEDPSPRSTIAI